jgi:hypothetical protein
MDIFDQFGNWIGKIPGGPNPLGCLALIAGCLFYGIYALYALITTGDPYGCLTIIIPIAVIAILVYLVKKFRK